MCGGSYGDGFLIFFSVELQSDMSRYKRKTNRKLVFTEENLAEAKRKIAAGASKRSVAAALGIGESTLRKRLKCGGNVPLSLGRFKKVFSEEMEIELARQVRELDQRFYGITKKDLQIAAYKFAEANTAEHSFNRDKKMAGESWITGFCKRRNITLRQPEKCSMGRIMGFNKSQVGRFFFNLKSLYERKSYTPDAIYNMDETGLSTVPNKLPKVLTAKGKKLVGKVASGERGKLVTAVCCMSATGNYVPPALIFSRKRMKEELYANSPPGTLKMISDSGFINAELFYQWIKHFEKFSKPSVERPVSLILDNHSSHRDLQVIQFCRENHIDLLSLPPHASHKMQPLDIGFFGPLKRAYSSECDNWMVSNPGKVITEMQVAGLFNAAYSKVANIEKAQNSFRKAGIFPYAPDQFSEEEFAPSLVTDKPLEEVEDNKEVREILPKQEDVEVYETVQPFEQKCFQLGTPENSYARHITPPPCCSKNVEVDLMDVDILCEDGTIVYSQKERKDNENIGMKVSEILPLPHIKREPKRRQCKSQNSEILSSTPFKNQLESSFKDQKNKEDVARLKTVKKNFSKCVLPQTNSKKKFKAKQIIQCPGCDLEYEEPPSEDWIMCSQCENWWHQLCTTYVQGNFTCANCLI